MHRMHKIIFMMKKQIANLCTIGGKLQINFAKIYVTGSDYTDLYSYKSIFEQNCCETYRK